MKERIDKPPVAGELMTTSADVFEACRLSDRLFVLNPNFKRANFYSQQLRCLALIREMFRRDLLGKPAGIRLVVVGAGISGMTASAAALSGGVMVTLFEQGRMLASFDQATHRELHPNIISWPFQDPRAVTDLPFLNWACNPADRVAQDLLQQWRRDFAPVVDFVEERAVSIAETADGIEVVGSRGRKATGDVALLTTGWLKERGVGGFQGPEYWQPRTARAQDRTFVSGTGDGGLIDAAYQTFGVKTVAASRALVYALKDNPAVEHIRNGEVAALDKATAGDLPGAHRDLKRLYDRMAPEKRDADLLDRYRVQSQRGLTTLVHREETAYSPFAGPVNKLLLSSLTHAIDPEVTMERGTLSESGSEIVSTSQPKPLEKHNLVIRHGAAVGAEALLTPSQVDSLKLAPPSVLAAVTPDAFDADFYLHAPKRRLAPSAFHKPEVGSLEIQDRIEALLKHIVAPGADPIDARPDPDLTLKFDREESWIAVPRGTVDRDVQAVFPIRTTLFTLEIRDSAQLRFVGV